MCWCTKNGNQVFVVVCVFVVCVLPGARHPPHTYLQHDDIIHYRTEQLSTYDMRTMGLSRTRCNYLPVNADRPSTGWPQCLHGLLCMCSSSPEQIIRVEHKKRDFPQFFMIGIDSTNKMKISLDRLVKQRVYSREIGKLAGGVSPMNW